ncbi:MAG TPA: DUF2203 domain-containing protein [Thermoplasmata archaeon]
MGSSADLRVAPADVRVFSIDEANAVLGPVEGILQEMDPGVARLRELRELIEDLEQYFGEDLANAPLVDRERHGTMWREAENISESLDGDIARIHSFGCLVKDVGSGLVDFHGIVDGEIVFLCWKRGEPRIGSYHPLNTGFAGRKPLPTAI